MPIRQDTQVDAFADGNLLGGHDLQDTMPRLSAYCFRAHLRHGEVPVAFLYCPSIHAEQGPPSGPVYPALHVQFSSALLTASMVVECAGHPVQLELASAAAYVPAAHSAHPCVEIRALYLPEEQAKHSPLVPAKPALQWQSERREEEALSEPAANKCRASQMGSEFRV